jgi:hypothetical protein
MKLACIVALTILILSAPFVNAQAVRLRGTVFDPSGAVIPEVDLKLSQGSSVVAEGKTDATGNFSFDVPSGDYRLETSAQGFRQRQQNVRVAANMRPLSISLTVATVDSVVDVAARDDRVSLEQDANLTQTTIQADAVKDLPEDEDAMMAQLQALAAGGGAAGASATFLVDGFSNGRVPPRDQIQQIIIDTNVFSAERVGGGPLIQVITKPGTGPWSGNVNLAFNNQALNARNPFDPTKLKKQQRIFTTSYGGPVIPGKLTLRFNARTLQQDTENGSIIAITPSGRVNESVFTPVKNQNLNLNGQVFITQSHSINFAGNYNTNEQRNQGVGGVTLAERAMNFKGHNLNLQLTERGALGSKLTSEIRFYWFHNQNSLLPITEGYSINVLDAFNSGGAQNRTRRRGTNYNFGNTLRWAVRPTLNLTLGTDFTYNKNYSSSETNYLGQFVFSSLEDFVAERPITFRRTTGDPVVNVNQFEGALFVQADWRVNPKLNVGAGIRYQAQANLRDYNNAAPTFQIAYQPRNGTVIRAGGRLSYQVYNIANVETVLRQDGLTHQVETVILNPSYPDPFVNGSSAIPTANNASIRTRASNFAAPYTINSAVTLEQSLKKGWRFSTSFDVTRGVHLLRTRNINAPYPGTLLPEDLFNQLNSSDPLQQAAARAEVDRMRPLYPNIGNIYQFESSADSFSKNLGVRLYTPNNFAIHGIGITGFVQYTLGWARDNASAMNQYDWRSEWALSSFDTRHRYISNLTVRMPMDTSVSFLVIANSGRPYSLTTGKDDNGDQSTNDRPAGVTRNSLIGPGSYTVNMSFTKQFALRKPEAQRSPSSAAAGPASGTPQMIVGGPGGPTVIPQGPTSSAPGPKLAFNVNANNLLNNTRVTGYSGVLTSPLFGKPIGAAAGRTVMLGLNLSF